MAHETSLRVYVVYHPAFEAGARYARHIAWQFDRLGETRERTPSAICTRVRCAPLHDDDGPRPIAWDLAEVNMVILLTEGRLRDELTEGRWQGFYRDLVARVRDHGDATLVVNVAFTQAALNLAGVPVQTLRAYEFVRGNYTTDLEDGTPNKNMRQILLTLLAVCGLFIDRRLNARPDDEPLKVFLSHTTRNGRMIADELATRLDQVQALGAFLDSRSLIPGLNFHDGLEKAIRNSVFLAIYTDDYSERRWTRWEMLKAKQYRRPILVVHLLKTGESRTFPYAYNTPLRVVAWRWATHAIEGEETSLSHSAQREIDHILLALMAETLRVVLFNTDVRRLTSSYPRYAKHFPRALELSDLASLAPEKDALVAAGKTDVIYPDPPLDAAELDLIAPLLAPLRAVPLSVARGARSAATVGQSAYADEGPLHGKRIAVSAGTVSPAELDRLGIPALGHGVTAIDHALAAAVTVLTQLGGCVVYGGDLRPDGFTARLFNEVADANRRLDLKDRLLYEHHLSWSAWRKERGGEVSLTAEALVDHVCRHEVIGTVHLYLPDGSALMLRWEGTVEGIPAIRATAEGDGAKPFAGDIRGPVDLLPVYGAAAPDVNANPEQLEGDALSRMRRRMAEREAARVIFAGKTSGHSGHYPGVAEEALATLEANKLLLVCGGFGGAALDVAEALGLITAPMPRPVGERGRGYAEIYEKLAGYRERYLADLMRRSVDLDLVRTLAASDNPSVIADILRTLLVAA